MWRVERITNLFVVNNYVEVKDLTKPVKFYVSGDLVAYGDVNEAIEYHIREVGDWERCSKDFYRLLKRPMLIAKRGDLINIYKLDDYAYLIEYIASDDKENSYKCLKVIKCKDYGEECNELLGYFYVKGFIQIVDEEMVVENLKNSNYEIYHLEQ
jgi:hypothetical protein